MRRPFAPVLMLVLTLLVMVASRLAVGELQAARSQAGVGGSRSVWDSVYSSDQADAGKLVYQETCSGCHGADLNGGKGARGLRGDAFLRDWGGDNLARLYQRTKTLMPRNAPASLRDDQYLNVVAYILQVNEFPAGTQALAADQLDQIQVFGKDGPASVPDFALVTVVGCLTQGPNNTWILTNSSTPVMTRDPAASKDADLKKAEEKALGVETVQVVDAFPAPDPHKGHKVEAKGFLMRAKNTITLTSLQSVAPTCEK